MLADKTQYFPAKLLLTAHKTPYVNMLSNKWNWVITKWKQSCFLEEDFWTGRVGEREEEDDDLCDTYVC